jgi:hypothetical protein
MAQITITGTAKFLTGAALPNAKFILRRNPLALVPEGAGFFVPEIVIVTSNGAAAVNFTIESGPYTGTVMTSAGEVTFSFNVAASPAAQTFGECLENVPADAYSALELALLLSGLPFYNTRPAAHSDTNLASGAMFVAPNGTSGLTVWEKQPMGGGIFTSNNLGTVFPSGSIIPGTLGAPGLAVSGDANTGLYAPAADQLAGVVGGVLGWLISSAGMQITGPVTGTAVTQTAQDVTAGRLLKTGDGGINLLAGVNYLADIDNGSIPQGLWQTDGAGPGTLGTFPAGQNRYGHMLNLRLGTNEVWQVYKSIVGRRIFSRARTSGAWSAWEEIYHAGSILGTVAQSGGVPTGALMQPGSGANGNFVRYADGRLECRHTLAASAAGAVTWTFPSAFIAAPVVQGTAIATVSATVCQDAAPTTTAATFSVRDKTDARRADTVHLLAVGRWF